jgi:hypothetical protein
MTTAQIARELGMVLCPAQELYRFHRRCGVDRQHARTFAKRGAGAMAAAQTSAVLSYILMTRHDSQVASESQ